MVTDVAQAKVLINEALQEQLAVGGILHSSFYLTMTHRIEEYLKKQCEVGGIVHNLLNKPKDDNVRGVAKMMMNKGDKLLPAKIRQRSTYQRTVQALVVRYAPILERYRQRHVGTHEYC